MKSFLNNAFIKLILYILGGIFILLILTKLLNSGGKKMSFSEKLSSTVQFILGLSLIGAVLGYINKIKADQVKENENVEKILNEFTNIDKYLFEKYDENRVFFDIIYNKVQLPSSDGNINEMFKKLTKKQKDFIFIIFNILTYLLEKIFVINPNLFSNENIGLKVRLYIENSLYFEYWANNYILFNISFQNFMNKKYFFLEKINPLFTKEDGGTHFIPYTLKNNFLF